MANKKIFFITSSYYPSIGGVEKHVKKVAEIIASKGYTVKVFVRYDSNYPSYQKINNVEVRRIPKKDGSPFIYAWCAKNKKIFDGAIIHSHDYFPMTIRKFLKKNHWVHTFHGYEGYPLDPLAIESRKRVAKSVDYTFCVGSFIEKWYGTKCDEIIWGAAEKPKIINNHIKYDFIFYGRFEKDTGFQQYVRAFNKIKNERPLSSMIAVGWGSQLDWALEYSKKHSLGIKFKHAVSDIYPFLAQSRIAFVSGYQAIIESSLMKKPIIAYYGTPIKKDYLEMHPMAKYLNISSSQEEIFQKALRTIKSKTNSTNLIYSWALKQNWQFIAERYIRAYNEN